MAMIDYDHIVWHPGRMGGAATIGPSRLTADTLASLVWAGDPPDEIAADYQVPVYAVELSCWWVALHQPHPCAWQRAARRAWLGWAHKWGDWAWSPARAGTSGHPGLPPSWKATP